METLQNNPKELLLLIIYIILIILGSSILIKILSTGRSRLEKKLLVSTRSEEQALQLHTLIVVGEYVLRIIILFTAAIWILSLFGVNVIPIITTVGVAGLAVSLSAQTIIKDYIGGMIILIENLFFIGDTLSIGTNTGIVEKITLRSTYIRDQEDRLIIIPNGDIRTFILEDRKKLNKIDKEIP